MADNILKLRVESSEYDQKLKKAAEGIRHLAEVAHRGGGELTGLEKAELDYVKSLGTMETKSRTAAGSVRELESTFKELTVVYNHLNDVEKQDEGGKALRASLDQIKQRALEARTELEAASKSLQGTESMKGGGGLFSGIGSKMEGALAVFGGNLMTKASEAVVQLGSEMYGMVQQGIEMARQGEGIRIAFERLGRGDILDGLRQATHGTVTDLELMKAAVKFNDFKLPLDELGTMLAFAQQKAKDTGQSIDYMTESLVTGLGRKSLMILDNLGLSATEIKEKMKETGDMTKAVGAIIREQMAKAGDYVETAADRAAQANVSLQNKMEELGRKFAPVEEASNQLWTSMKIGILDIIGGPLARLLNGLTEAGRLKNALNDINGDGSGGSETRTDKALRMLREYSGRGAEGKKDLYNRQVAKFQEQEERAWRKVNEARKKYDDELKKSQKRNSASGVAGGTANMALTGYENAIKKAEAEAKAFQIARATYEKGAQDILNPKPVSTGNGGTTDPNKKTGKTTKEDIKFADDSIMAQEKIISDLTQKWKTASGELRDGYLKDLEAAKAKLKEMTAVDNLPTFTMAELEGTRPKSIDLRGNEGKAQDKLDLATAAFATSGTSNVDFSNYTAALQNAIKDANIGSELYTQISEQLRDTTTVSTLLQELMERGMAGADLESTAQALKEKLLSPEGIDQTSIQSFLEGLNKQIEEAGGVGLKLNTETGEVTDDKDKGNDDGEGLKILNEGIGKMASGLSQVSNGLKSVGVEIPKEVDQVIGVISGVSQIISGVGTIVSIFGTTALAANTASVNANTFSIGALIAALETNTATNFLPFANGGIVPAFAQGGLIGRAAAGMMVPGNSMSGDRLRLPVDGGRGMIGVNSGELILNESSQNTLAADLLNAAALISSIKDYSVSLGNAQQTLLAQELEGGGYDNIQLDTVISGEDIRLVLNNNGRRTGSGEYVQSRK